MITKTIPISSPFEFDRKSMETEEITEFLKVEKAIVKHTSIKRR